MSRRLWLSLRRLLEVHSSGDCGSPRVSGSTSARRSSSKFASVSLRGLRPPPPRRTRSKSGVSPARNSASPRPIVLRAIPVARITAMIPPCPADVASAAAKRRRPRSSSTGARASKRWRMADSSITPKRYSLATPEGIPPANKIRSDPIHLFADGPLDQRRSASDFGLLLRPILVEHDPDHYHRAGRNHQRADHRQLFEDSDNGCPPAHSLPMREARPCHIHTETPFGPQQQCGLNVSTSARRQ